MERKLIGRVGVDSGQLMIIDPCYIEDSWKKDNESEILGIKFWGAGKDNAAIFLKNKGYEVIEGNDQISLIKTSDENVAQKIQEDLVEFLKTDSGLIVFSEMNTGSYQKVCELTLGEERAGQLGEVIGVAFQSGFGDGLYDVYATYKDCSFGLHEDKRISKVEIILIEDE
ncbi:hypothetical protein D7X33_19130 [Butyricicoccus sp. 1XD8-22]|nr:hypothetical protein D7X33_19130 [Butyricicoccus sp. 1XD8-22]